jgi:2-oxoglutarate dehydrogenase E1 component
MRSSPLSALDAGSLEQLQDQFRRQPETLDAGWRVLFQVLEELDAAPPRATPDAEALLRQAIRAHGHLLARTAPLAADAPPPAAADFGAHVAPGAPAAAELARRYGGTLTVETAHIDAAAPRAWLQSAFESLGEGSPAALRETLQALIEGDAFERFLGRKFPTKKRFGAEGAEAIVPMLRRLLAQAAAAGITHVVIGAMHRGRLNLMATVLRKSATRMLAEIKGMHPFAADPPRAGDVPYHLGVEALLHVGDRALRVSLLPNPSHLEAIDPVALGRARALQDLLPEGEAWRVLPVILHTDAAVVAQGLVAETLQLGGTSGFGTAGTLHVVINNRLGFTTEEHEARSSTHCTGPWKAIDSAILHVNGDDPWACCQAVDLALGYRQAQARDAVIDLVCYRRNGHNEIDEPSFTQPVLYQAIARQVPVAEAFARRLVAQGIATAAEVDAWGAETREALQRAYEEAPGYRTNESGYPGGNWTAHLGHGEEPDTGVAEARLRDLAARLAAPPAAVALHPKLGRILRQRELGAERVIAWPTAEALAFATLLTAGVPVRLSGQDVLRGAFSHRHFAIADTATGERHVGLQHLAPEQARFAVHNSPLSEYAVLGFEYGYSLERPEALTIWEAQFGDFANGAQIMIDQFITAGEEKWCLPSGLVLLLPHGLEGQGPEHSSARIERWLQLCARDNIRLANPSTPANYFHLLRRQVLARGRKPLVVTSPKKLLRLPAAVSPLDDFLPGMRFQAVLASAGAAAVTRVLLCTGKIAYELEEERARRGAADVAILRLEQLYPFPADALRAALRGWPGASMVWVQEEPQNMGAWSWLDRRMEALLRGLGAAAPVMRYCGRPESPSPAGGFHDDHDNDQQRIVAEAFA